MTENRNTFVRYADRVLRWALGERAHRLTSTLAGLLPDLRVDAVRQVVRWTMPLTDTPVDALPYLLQRYGLPSYVETYQNTLIRLRAYIDTHERAGAKAQLIEELNRAGLAVVNIDVDNTLSAFAVVYGAGVVPTYGSGPTYGQAGLIFGAQVTPTEARNTIRLMTYFKPARERWTGFVGV